MCNSSERREKLGFVSFGVLSMAQRRKRNGNGKERKNGVFKEKEEVYSNFARKYSWLVPKVAKGKLSNKLQKEEFLRNSQANKCRALVDDWLRNTHRR